MERSQVKLPADTFEALNRIIRYNVKDELAKAKAQIAWSQPGSGREAYLNDRIRELCDKLSELD